MRTTHLVIALLLALAAAGGCSDIGTDAVQTVATQLPAFETLPPYATALWKDQVANVLDAEIGYGSTNVWATQPFVTVGAAPPIVKLTASSASLQGVAVGQDNAGATYAIVVIVDYMANTSTLERFVDVNGDGLPDQSTRTTLAAVPNSHLVQPALHLGIEPGDSRVEQHGPRGSVGGSVALPRRPRSPDRWWRADWDVPRASGPGHPWHAGGRSARTGRVPVR